MYVQFHEHGCSYYLYSAGTSVYVGHAQLIVVIVAVLILLLPCTHAQGVKQSVCLSIVVVVGTKIARSCVLGICVCYKHNQLVDIGEKLVCTRFELLKKAY